jgi:hypothetical protein
VDKQLKKSIVKWQKEIWTRDFGDSLFGPSAILSNTAVESLSSFGNLKRLVDVESALGGYWAWFGRYGDELLNLFKSLEVGPKQPKPSKPRAAAAARGEKRAAQPGDGDVGGVKEDQSKRRRTLNVGAIPPTPVNQRPGSSTSRRLPPPPSTPNQQLQPVYPHTPAMSSSPRVLYSPPGIPAGIRRNPVDSGNSAESNFGSGACKNCYFRSTEFRRIPEWPRNHRNGIHRNGIRGISFLLVIVIFNSNSNYLMVITVN